MNVSTISPEDVSRLRLGELLRDRGLDQVEQNDSKQLLQLARSVAWVIAHDRGHVTIDDVRSVLETYEVTPHHPNLWGAVFRIPHWKIVGYTKSTRPSNHARRIAVYIHWTRCTPTRLSQPWRHDLT